MLVSDPSPFLILDFSGSWYASDYISKHLFTPMTILHPQHAEIQIIVANRNLAAESVVSFVVRVVIDTVSRYLFVVFEK